MKLTRRRIAGLVVGALLLGPLGYWAAVVNVTDLKAQRTIIEYHLPKDFAGWAAIRFDVAGAPALPFAPAWMGGTTTIKIPASGMLETSSAMNRQWHTARYFRWDGSVSTRIEGDPTRDLIRDSSSGHCTLLYVSATPLAPGDAVPPYSGPGCD